VSPAARRERKKFTSRHARQPSRISETPHLLEEYLKAIFARASREEAFMAQFMSNDRLARLPDSAWKRIHIPIDVAG